MKTENTEWRKIAEYEDYQVSNDGRVYSARSGKELVQRECKGYLYVYLYNENGRKAKSVHRLVAKAFVPGYFDGAEVNHKDENPKNNNADNLEWCTPKYNSNYGTHRQKMRELNLGKNNHFYGRKHTAETIAKMRAARLGKPSNTRKPIVVNGKQYSSMSECAKAIGISLTKLHDIKTGKCKNNINIKIE